MARPEERAEQRLESPQTDWDILHGLIQAYRRGESTVARSYLEQHATQSSQRILDLLDVWAAEVAEELLQKEAETMRFDLNPRSPSPSVYEKISTPRSVLCVAGLYSSRKFSYLIIG